MRAGPRPADHRSRRPATRPAERAVAILGLVLLASAIGADQRWLDSHFLPSFFLSRHAQVLVETVVRLTVGACGVALALGARSRVAAGLTQSPAHATRILLAILLALGASELTLRRTHLRPSEWQVPHEEPRRRADSRLGWRYDGPRVGRTAIGGRVVEYAFDDQGRRVSHAGEILDPLAPTVVFTGESVMLGYGLTWTESVPGQVAARMHVQVANLAVNGFATDQAFLALAAELPRFNRPVAVVSLFMTTLFARNLDDDRPHLGPGLVWLPAAAHGPLWWLANVLVPYHSKATVERGIAVTREVFRATADLARTRGAAALVVVPHFGREEAVEETLRHRLLDGAGIASALVELDPAWTLPQNRHPDAHAAQAIAGAVVAALSSVTEDARATAARTSAARAK